MTHTVPLVIGIAGGSGSGKTTVAQEILQRVGPDRIAFLQHDAYYKDLSGLPPTQRAEVNFDHPDSLETELLIAHIKQLKLGNPVEIPIYDFAHHSRTNQTYTVRPRGVILVEGILIFVEPALRAICDVKIFVDTDSDIRFIRRIQRDIAERGRTIESVIRQYLNTVRPMHLEFVEPSKRLADVIIPEGGMNIAALDMVVARIDYLLHSNIQDSMIKKESLKPLSVFLCHAHDDKPAVRILAKKLQTEGLDVWLDEDKLLGGQEWELEIPKAVNNSDIIVVCLSNKATNKTGYIQKEIRLALDATDLKPPGTTYIIPALLEENCKVPPRLQKWQWVKIVFDGRSLDQQGFLNLMRSLDAKRR